jgi:hypothetical protein
MRRPPHTALLWLVGTTTIAAALALVAWGRGRSEAYLWLVAGIGVSLVTLVASKATVVATRSVDKPLASMLVETCVRMALPLATLLAVAIARRDLLTTEFLLYFLPFQFLTIIASVAGSVGRIRATTHNASGNDV